MKQILLPISVRESSYKHSDFVVSCCNLEAYRAVTDSTNWPLNRLLIIGEPGAGKTHLTKIWQREYGAIYIEKFSDLEQQHSHFIIENINESVEETDLMHIINIALEKKARLLLTMNGYKNFQIPDLRSRINATYKILIKDPDESMISVLVSKMLHDRQIKFSKEVLQYVATRLHRSFKQVSVFVQHLDQLSLVEKRNVTIPFVKFVLDDLGLYGEEIA